MSSLGNWGGSALRDIFVCLRAWIDIQYNLITLSLYSRLRLFFPPLVLSCIILLIVALYPWSIEFVIWILDFRVMNLHFLAACVVMPKKCSATALCQRLTNPYHENNLMAYSFCLFPCQLLYLVLWERALIIDSSCNFSRLLRTFACFHPLSRKIDFFFHLFNVWPFDQVSFNLSNPC
jgi:hypothetical protein